MNRALVPLEDRFLARCKPVESGCIEWQAGFNKDRYGKDTYGQFYADGKMHLAHRWIWKRKKGAVPDTLDVCHSCDNTKCVNLNHLFVGTRKQNMEDAVAKGRTSHVARNEGETHPMSVLNEDDVRYIRMMYEQKYSMTELSIQFKVSIAQISRIIHYQSWRNV